MKKVQFTKGHRYALPGGASLAPVAVKGDVRELDNELADTLVSQGVAKLVEAPKAEATKSVKPKSDKSKKPAADKSVKPDENKKPDAKE